MKRRAPPRITVLGGGSGLSTLLSGLKRSTDQITAVVTVTDEGGSSGRLRRARHVLPPGDLRNRLVALAQDGTLLSRLFQYRFPEAAGPRDFLQGHAFGNLFLTALASVAGGFDRALAAASQVLNIRGSVLPVSLDAVRLSARLADGRRVTGETRISASRARIERVSLKPASPAPSPGVMDALRRSDLVVLGPGSLYTSVIPPLLVPGVVEAISRSRALRVYVANLMTQPGETDGHTAVDHLEALVSHVKHRTGGRPLVDVMLVNKTPFPARTLRRYARYGSYPIAPPPLDTWGPVRIVRAALGPPLEAEALPAAGRAPVVRHSPALLSRAVLALLTRERRP